MNVSHIVKKKSKNSVSKREKEAHCIRHLRLADQLLNRTILLVHVCERSPLTLSPFQP